MTVTLDLKPEAEALLTARARAQGVAVETYLLRMIETLLAPLQIEDTADTLEDDLPFIQPLETRRVPMQFVSAGAFRFPAVDESDRVDHDA